MIHFSISGQFVGIDYDHNTLKQLQDYYLIQDVYSQILMVRETMRIIQSSSLIWLMSIEGDPIGLVFELALACQQCFVVNGTRFGLRELEFGLFPMFGSCEQLILDETLLRKDLESFPVRSTTAMRDWSKFFTLVQNGDLNESLLQYEKKIGKVAAKKPKLVATNLVHRLSDALYRKLGNEFPFSNYEWRTKRPWQIAWNLIRDRLPKKDPDLFICSLSFLNARIILGAQFLVWLERKLEYDVLASNAVALPKRKPVLIDLEYLVPPVEPLIRLLDHGYTIIFATLDVQKLKESFDLIQARMDRVIEKSVAKSLWQRGIYWVQAEVPNIREGYYVLRWFPDDHVNISAYKDNVSILRFQGNRGNSRSGWGEIPVPQEERSFHERDSVRFAYTLCDGLIETKPLDGLSVSGVVRCLLLQELLAVAKRVDGGLGRIMPMLREVGWGFLADDNSWEYFLRSRDEGLVVHAEAPSLGNLKIAKSIWQMGLWKEAREQGYTRSKLSSNAIWLSHHFAMFCAIIAEQIAEGHLTDSVDAADILVAELAGFPAKLGSPLAYSRRKGPKRTAAYWYEFRQRYVQELS